jgi:hypothetical protein
MIPVKPKANPSMHEPNHANRLALIVALCISSALVAQTKKPAPSVSVPFVGCKSDGQQGPQDAPTGTSKSVRLAPELAQQLAYYQAQYGLGVLAPRGWYCFGAYGSNGESIYVAPVPITSEEFFSETWKGFTGPAVQLSGSTGDTSGRFDVAKTIARVFPAHKAFAKRVIAEGLEPASSFPFGPYPNDKLTYKSNSLVEYVTPANTDGLGTASHLLKNSEPIRGLAELTGEELSLTFLAARLPANLAELTPAIIRQVERDVAKADQ